MCLAVYIASDHPLPLIPWNEKHREFNVVPLTRYESEIKKQFRQSHIVYAGTHVACDAGHTLSEKMWKAAGGKFREHLFFESDMKTPG